MYSFSKLCLEIQVDTEIAPRHFLTALSLLKEDITHLVHLVNLHTHFVKVNMSIPPFFSCEIFVEETPAANTFSS